MSKIVCIGDLLVSVLMSVTHSVGAKGVIIHFEMILYFRLLAMPD